MWREKLNKNDTLFILHFYKQRIGGRLVFPACQKPKPNDTQATSCLTGENNKCFPSMVTSKKKYLKILKVGWTCMVFY